MDFLNLLADIYGDMINRFQRFSPRDYSMEWFVPQEVMPNIEAWSSLLAEQQQKYDTTKMLLSEKMPKYLQTEGDRELLGQYKQLVDESVNNISKQYQEQGVTAGNRAMKDAIRMFTQQWQPGGMAATLEDRYGAYQSALKEIETSYKDDPRGINKQFASSQLQRQLSDPINYNAETGEYKRINTPELYKDPNIQNLILKAIDQVKESGNTDIIRLSPTMLEKIKTEGRSANVLQSVGEAIYNQYPKQLAIEAWYRAQNSDPNAIKAEYESNLDSIVKKQDDLFSNKSKLGKEEVKRIQSDLVRAGYDLKIDGQFGPNTEKAFKDYNAKTRERVNEQKQNFNMDNYMMSQVTKDYDNFARQFANQKVDKSIIFDQAELARMKIAASKRNTQSLISGFQQILNPETNLIGATPDKGVNIEAWDKQLTNANRNLNDAKNLFNKAIGNDAAKVLGTNPNNISGLIEAYSKTGGDPNAFYNLIQADPKYAASRNIDLRKAFDYIQNNNDSISSSTNAYVQAQQQVDMLNATQESFTKQYSEKEGKKDYEDLRKQYKKPWETDEQFRQAINNRDSRFNTSSSLGVGSGTIVNKASEFLNKRNSVAKSNPEYAKSVRTYEISADESDKAFGTFSKSILADIDNNDYYGYVDEDQQGFSWKTKEGDKKEGTVSNKKVSLVSFGENGAPQIKVTGKIKDEDGKESYVETYLNVPELRKGQTKQILLATKAQAKRTNDEYLDEVADLTIAGISGDINYSKVASQDAMKLHYDNTNSVPILMPVYNQRGEITQMRNTEMRGTLMDTEEIGGRKYNKYKVLGDDGSSYYRLTVQTPKGEAVVTNKKGGLDFNSSSAVDVFLRGKTYDQGLSVSTTINKVPTGEFITPAAIGAIVESQSSNESVMEDENTQE